MPISYPYPFWVVPYPPFPSTLRAVPARFGPVRALLYVPAPREEPPADPPLLVGPGKAVAAAPSKRKAAAASQKRKRAAPLPAAPVGKKRGARP